MGKGLKTVVILLSLTLILRGSAADMIPTSSWIYESVEVLQAAGYFQNLDKGNRPWSRFEISSILIDIDVNDLSANSLKIELGRLLYEFKSEIEVISSSGEKDNFRFYVGLSDNYLTNARNYISIRLSGSLNLNRNLSLKYGAYVDQHFMDDPYYDGYEWRGFQGYQEQMYINWNSSNIDLKFGRDYIKWGYGHTGNLLISDNSRPFDQFSLKVRSRYISFQTFVAQLDKMYNANRYLNAARFEIKPVANLSVGLGQSSLYGGENQSLDFTMSNPLAFYSFTQDNDRKSMNMMLYADFAWYFRNKYKLYSEFLVDDFQIDHKVKSDLEPNELAFLFGIQAVDLFFDTHGWLEFVQVRNRTYNVPDARPFEKFLHKNMPIAHPLGTDFQLFQIHLDRWMNSHFRLDLDYSLLRQGEGTIRGEFTEPWMADEVTMETGYKEKIPYGIIETTNKIYASLHYEYNVHLQSDLSIGYETIDNLEHLEGNKSVNLFLNLNLYLAFDCLKIF